MTRPEVINLSQLSKFITRLHRRPATWWDTGGNLLSPLYSVYFLNRATLWRYILPGSETGSISDATSTYSFTSLGNDITSTTPIPLTDALLSFKLTINSNDFSPIPCADARRLTSLTQAGDTYACSEIYINY